MRRVDAESSFICYDERSGGRLVTLKTAFADPHAHYWAKLNLDVAYAFHIPRGSIKQDFVPR